MRVAIDGPAGAGKTTVARKVGARMGFFHLDSGAMYRAVALASLRRDIPPHDRTALSRLARSVRISFADGRVLLDGEDVTREIRASEVEAIVSQVAAIPEVREAMVARQREIGREGDVVAEGRDIGTVVWPDAEVKIFLTASLASRAHRRQLELGARPVHNVLEDIRRRDEKDSSRSVSPLRAAPDAIVIDTTDMSVGEVVARIEEIVEERRR